MRSVAWTLAIAALACAPAAAERVDFVVNDALLKDQLLEQVTVRIAATDAPNAGALVQGLTNGSGTFSADLKPGTYYVSYSKPGYVRILRTPTVVSGAAGQVVTTSLALSLEAEGLAEGTRRLKLVLNWGNDHDAHPSDLDSHLLHLESGAHVYFAQRVDYSRPEQQLDVDDIDWGGPETVTLTDPLPGTYYYWVHNYSGSPPLHQAELVVRLFSGDTLQAEYRPKAAVLETYRAWRPFAAIHVTNDSVTITDWDADELERDPSIAYALPPGLEEEDYTTQANFSTQEPVEIGSFCCVVCSLLAALLAAGLGLRSLFKN